MNEQLLQKNKMMSAKKQMKNFLSVPVTEELGGPTATK